MQLMTWRKRSKQERRHNAFERRINAQEYIKALTEYSFGLLDYLYLVNARGSCRIKQKPQKYYFVPKHNVLKIYKIYVTKAE